MERYVPEPRRKNRKTATLLAFFFGIFGVHKFYLNNKGAGVFFIMLFVMSVNIFKFPLSMLLGVIDGFKLLNMSEDEFDHKYNTKSARTGQRYNRRKERQSRREKPDFRRRTKGKQTQKRTRPVAKKKSTKFRKENAYVKTGIQKYKDFDLDDAIIDFNKGLEIDETNVALHFNIACAYSLTEQKDKAFHHLSKAVANGLKDVDKINTHEDLAFVRIQSEYADFKSNGFQLGRTSSSQSNTSQQANASSVSDDLLSRLNKLAELRKRGLLSEKEFAMEKEKLMS